MPIESIYQVLLSPRMSEKSTALQEQKRYTFVVADEATKRDIKEAVEKIFKVRVESVRVMNTHGKGVTRHGQSVGSRKGMKKAIVRLHPEDKIEVI